ncbi:MULTISPECIES: hypothetical protein [unclassified Sphingopyxis]|uniref:hypothetical protein n=1 Tax=unclassified Sphingopyxis TaxID=2614943 RepID=UPI0006C0F854|nr:MULTISPECIES: hypothetical protein [unclassified Sphingopyxis]USI79211.1 hypothetical protein KEC45_10080 [Sphingopyxis sp. USTB-05]GAO78350.1 hypothetical protein SC1_01653 [Sphingopyxis sp. C-1]
MGRCLRPLENGRIILARHTGPYGDIQSAWKQFRIAGFANRDVNLMIPADTGYFHDQLSKAYELYDQLCV